MEGGEAADAVDCRPVDLDADQEPGHRRSLYAFSKKNNMDYNLVYIPGNFPDTSTQAFDPDYMGKLFDLGFRLETNGNPWKQVPPRWVH